MKREFLQNLKVGDQALPKEVIDAIMEEHGKSVQGAKAWKEKYDQAVQEHEKQLRQLSFGHSLDSAIAKAKGRNVKAIAALLDVEALRESSDPEAAITAALEQVKQENAYLFEEAQVPPPYARGTGAQAPTKTAPTTLAGALRERFERKQ